MLPAEKIEDVFKTFHRQKITLYKKSQKITYFAVFNHICIHNTLFSPVWTKPCIFYLLIVCSFQQRWPSVKGSIILVIAYTTSIRSVRPRFIIHNLLAPEKISNASLDSFQFYPFFYTIVSGGCLQMFKISLFIRNQFPHQFRHNFDWYINKYNASYPHIVHMFLCIQLTHVLDNECYQTIYTAQYTSCTYQLCVIVPHCV